MERDLAARLIVIEGKRAERASFVGGLAKKGFQVTSVPSGNTGLSQLEREAYDLIVVDADSMRTSGKRICQSLRDKFAETPLILIVGDAVDAKNGFEADVILVLPFTLQKLLNRIKVLLPVKPSNDIIKAGPIELDITHKFIHLFDKHVSLTPRLVRLLQALMAHPGEVFDREDLFRLVWETDYTADTRTLDVHISWLRQVLEQDPRHPDYIKTVRGVGYRLDLD
jgi:DNA-binding response OmpR family regulator